MNPTVKIFTVGFIYPLVKVFQHRMVAHLVLDLDCLPEWIAYNYKSV